MEDIPQAVESLRKEFIGAALGDKRRTERLAKIAIAAATKPADGFPTQAGSEAALEGTYRLLGNDDVRWQAILAAHGSCTAQRASQLPEIVVAHDTTSFKFEGETARKGLGRLPGGKQGFYAHVAFGQRVDGRPLGVVGMAPWTRMGPGRGKRSNAELQADNSRESLRWGKLVNEVEEVLAGRTSAIHVMDREADDYQLLSELVQDKHRFVIRVFHDRGVAPGGTGGASNPEEPKRLFAALDHAAVTAEREVVLSRRTAKGKPKKQLAIHPARDKRTALLAVAACSITLRCPQHRHKDLPAELKVNFVHVFEPNPPAGQDPVCWRLATTEPVDTPEQMLRVVDFYRRRWVIEEFFKALKTGCKFQSRQLGRSSSKPSRQAASSRVGNWAPCTLCSTPSPYSAPSHGVCSCCAGWPTIVAMARPRRC